MAIKSRIPITQYSERVIYSNGSHAIRCYTNSCPHYLYDEKGSLIPIELSNESDVISRVGPSSIRNKNLVSVGWRRSSSRYKYMGFRPSRTQSLGTEQIEFSIVGANINGEDIPIHVGENEEIDPITRKLGNVYIRSNRRVTQQILEVPKNIEVEDFKVEYVMHLKGFRVANDIDENGYYIENESGSFSLESTESDFKCALVLPILMNEEFEDLSIDWYGPRRLNLTRHTLRKKTDGEYEYIKLPGPEFSPMGIDAVRFIDAAMDNNSEAVYDDLSSYSSSRYWDSAKDATTGDRSAGRSTASVLSFYNASTYYVNRIIFNFRPTVNSKGDKEMSKCKFNFKVSTASSSTSEVYLCHITNGSDTGGVTDFSDGDDTWNDFGYYRGVVDGPGHRHSARDASSTGWIQFVPDNDTLRAINEQINSNGSQISVGLCDDHDLSDSAPSSLVNALVYCADQTGTSDDPYMEFFNDHRKIGAYDEDQIAKISGYSGVVSKSGISIGGVSKDDDV